MKETEQKKSQNTNKISKNYNKNNKKSENQAVFNSEDFLSKEGFFEPQNQNFKRTKKIETVSKLSKNIIYARKKIEKQNLTKQKQNSKRIKKCNREILTKDAGYKEIYLTIDRFNNNGKKTVVYFVDSFYPIIDGVVAVLDNYAVQMQKYYNVVICAPKHKGTCYKTNKYFLLQSDSIYLKAQGYDLAFPQLDAVFQKYISLLKIDLVHIQAPFNMGTYGLSLAKKRKIPSISTFHSQFKQNFYNAVKNETIAQWLTSAVMNIYNKTNYTATMNTFAAGIMKSYGYTGSSIEIVPNATNLKEKEFSPAFEKSVLERLKINKNTFNMIFIGRFVEVKNVYFIIDVITEVFKKNQNFNFIFLGYGPEQGKMQKILQKNGLENHVKFTGKIDSVDEKSVIIKNSDLLFFPSDYDTDGIVKIECACYGVPTLCIENTGVSCNMTNNHNGFTEKYDKQSFVNRILYLLKNVDFVKKVGENCKRELYITWEDTCEILNKLYQKALSKKSLKNKKKISKNKNKEHIKNI